MMKRMRNLTGKDKRLHSALEFHSRLLKGLTITSEQVKTWRDRIKSILTESNGIADIYFVYTALPADEEKYDLELFWLNTPSTEAATMAEGTVRNAAATDARFESLKAGAVVHTSVLSSALRPFARNQLELRARTFQLETPRVNCMVGVGTRAKPRKDRIDHNVVESVLTAIENIVSSVSALTTYTREIEKFATRDPLTGLYNQVAFWDLLKYETERSKRQKYLFSLLTIDIDNFKTVNDTFGHDVGDTFLKHFSSILKSAVRRGDIPARDGGDKFSAILPVCDEEQAYMVAQRIIENLRKYSLTLPDGTGVKATASVGIAVYPNHAKDAQDLFLLADSMLHHAKSMGKDRLSFPSDEDNAEALRSIGEKNIMIMDAIGSKRIVPYFQPIIDMKTMRVDAYEVLTRIITPDRVVPAAEFIEAAEGMGAIGKIDYQLMELAFHKVKEKKYTGNLFLNLSPKVLMLTEFMPTLKKLLGDYGLDPAKMVFEITERDTVKNVKLIEKFIHDLKREGFRFAIDDFGAGYSSFQYIKTFHVDFLKVDGEFVRNMVEKGAMEKAIVTSIASLAGSLGIKTIAEFVESEEIMGEVKSVGLDYAQGYYIKRPSPDLD